MSRAAWIGLVAALVPLAVGATDAPYPRPLDATPPAAEARGAAEPLPRTVAVCRDGRGRRCWAAGTPAACAPSADGSGDVYRLVIDRPTDVDAALAACRESLSRPDTD
jgi:hypothetical protein